MLVGYPGELLMNMLKMLIVPLIVSTLVSGMLKWLFVAFSLYGCPNVLIVISASRVNNSFFNVLISEMLDWLLCHTYIGRVVNS